VIESDAVIPVREEYDVVRARGEGKAISARLGFAAVMQVKIATAISELARNIVLYAGRGTVTIRALTKPAPGIEVIAADEGPGIRDVEGVMSGTYRSKRGLGAGLRGTKKLMDHFEVETGKTGTKVTIRKFMT
jgi:serine/threonine-protein kinase RsbT